MFMPCIHYLFCFSYIGREVKSISSGAGPILMSHLYCNGDESSLLDCSHQSCYISSCNYNDAGVSCESMLHVYIEYL